MNRNLIACFSTFLLFGIIVHSLDGNQEPSTSLLEITQCQLTPISRMNFRKLSSSSINQYITHKPISIENNTDFITQAKNEGWKGSGSQESPYIIQGLHIHTSGISIKIENTDLFFILSLNSLEGHITEPIWAIEGSGIIFWNVTNGIIVNNTIWNAAAGIFLRFSSNNVISNNIIENNEYGGIRMHSSSNNTISNNIISDNGKSDQFSSSICGIFLKQSPNNTINNNIINNNNQYGINLYMSSDNFVSNNSIDDHLFAAIDMVNDDMSQYSYVSSYNNTFSKNTLSGSKWGIGIRGSDNVISENIIFNNKIGIYLGLYNFEMYLVGTIISINANKINVSDNIISNNSSGVVLANSLEIRLLNNIIYNNTNYGIKIDPPSKDNLVKRNDFITNNLDGFSQAFDNGSSNTFLNNYWYEWISPDSDGDNIVDKPYSIAGDIQNTDPFPLVHPFNPNSPTDITTPLPKSSPGWNFVILWLVFITVIALRKVKE